jgi:hypothetical protein
MADEESLAGGRPGAASLTIRFGSKNNWTFSIGLLIVTAFQLERALSGGGRTHTGYIFALLAFALINASIALTGWRFSRGLTLNEIGLIWHAWEVFVPWSNVRQVQVGAVSEHLVVEVEDLGALLADLTPHSRRTAKTNLERYGAPIAIQLAKLAMPAADIIAAAERFKAENTGAHLADQGESRSRVRRDFIIMRVSNTLAGLALLALIAALFHQHMA